jgi:hypothetical protein
MTNWHFTLLRANNLALQDKNIQWLEEMLASINDEFRRRTGIPLSSGYEGESGSSSPFHS